MPNSSDLENKVLQELADALEMGGKGNDYQAQSKDRYNNCDRVNFKLKQEQQEVYNCWTAEMIGNSSVKEIRFSQHRGVLHKTRRRSWLEGICPCRWKQFVRRLSSGKPYSHLMIEDGLLTKISWCNVKITCKDWRSSEDDRNRQTRTRRNLSKVTGRKQSVRFTYSRNPSSESV